jgi:hypothetical protein
MSEKPNQENKQPWTSQEIATVRAHRRLGAETLAEMLGRSVHSVKMAAYRNRISLRREHEHRGSLLGQRRGESWADAVRHGITRERLEAMRKDALGGVIDLGELERRIKAELYGPERPLCPSCGQRNVERVTTGLCEPCHHMHLARQHRESVDRLHARRDLDAARQEASRARRGKSGVVIDLDSRRP